MKSQNTPNIILGTAYGVRQGFFIGKGALLQLKIAGSLWS